MTFIEIERSSVLNGMKLMLMAMEMEMEMETMG